MKAEIEQGFQSDGENVLSGFCLLPTPNHKLFNSCHPLKFFANHQLTADIIEGWDWASLPIYGWDCFEECFFSCCPRLTTSYLTSSQIHRRPPQTFTSSIAVYLLSLVFFIYQLGLSEWRTWSDPSTRPIPPLLKKVIKSMTIILLYFHWVWWVYFFFQIFLDFVGIEIRILFLRM